MRTNSLWKLFCLGAACSFVVFVHEASAAVRLFLDPDRVAVGVGETLSVSVVLDTGGTNINLVDAELVFPPDKLEAVSVSSDGSVVKIWTDTPLYDNRAGRVSFQGGTPNPGINTRNGVVTTVAFRARAAGEAVVRISDQSRVFLNDGFGTSVPGGRAEGKYLLTAIAVPPFASPAVFSISHPDPDRWYAAREAKIRWQAEAGAEGYSYLLTNTPFGMPDDEAETVAKGVDYENLEDGQYYFHLKAIGGGGEGGTAMFGLRIDSAPPEPFEVRIFPSARTSSRQPTFYFDARDALSGIGRYEVAVSRAEEAVREEAFHEAQSPYAPPEPLELGKHEITVRASDKAGNIREVTESFEIVRPIFEIVEGQGIRFGSSQVSWRAFWAGLGILLVLLGRYVFWRITLWRRRAGMEEDRR